MREISFRPIILVGTARSGTTMLATLFKELPGIAVWHEPRTLWNYADPSRRHDRFLEEDADLGVCSYIRRRFEGYARSRNASVLFEKTPVNVLRVPYVARIFPEATFVHVVRHPLAVAVSASRVWSWKPGMARLVRRVRETPTSQLHHYFERFVREVLVERFVGASPRRVWGLRYPGYEEDLEAVSTVAFAGIQWLHAVATARNDLRDLEGDRVIALRYEDLLASPSAILTELLGRLRIDASDGQVRRAAGLIQSSRAQHWSLAPSEDAREILAHVEVEAKRWGYLEEGVGEATEGGLLGSRQLPRRGKLR